jgi:hypothetical protein
MTVAAGGDLAQPLGDLNGGLFFFLRLDLLLLLHRRLWLPRMRWKHLLFVDLPLGHLETHSLAD